MISHEPSTSGSAVLRRGRRTAILTVGEAGGREPGLAGGGHTYFGYVFDRMLRSRGYNQSTFAAECRRRELRLRGPFKERDVDQRSVSNWMRGKTSCPREIPAYADSILEFSGEERVEFGMAYAYGQTISKAEFVRLFQYGDHSLMRSDVGR
jgi:hypothetical protein